MIEELFWFSLWLLLLYLVHLQFRVCIPVTVACLKIFESCALLILIKIFVFFQIYENGVDLFLLKNVTMTMFREAKNYASNLDL